MGAGVVFSLPLIRGDCSGDLIFAHQQKYGYSSDLMKLRRCLSVYFKDSNNRVRTTMVNSDDGQQERHYGENQPITYVDQILAFMLHSPEHFYTGLDNTAALSVMKKLLRTRFQWIWRLVLPAITMRLLVTHVAGGPADKVLVVLEAKVTAAYFLMRELSAKRKELNKVFLGANVNTQSSQLQIEAFVNKEVPLLASSPFYTVHRSGGRGRGGPARGEAPTPRRFSFGEQQGPSKRPRSSGSGMDSSHGSQTLEQSWAYGSPKGNPKGGGKNWKGASDNSRRVQKGGKKGGKGSGKGHY
ncbi:hypothetical protein CYMTET_11415 [Cymbomonas tetramitiformis]|uniref:Uncharacterized protein n=2 Tax=Cymbomonas tetramitiformis TaxID=36881 RepID=A0AAE0GMB7_9CHLO|nr:hypothetical protein CYMTET_11415 [Cymbomonas tetramitiformis]